MSHRKTPVAITRRRFGATRLGSAVLALDTLPGTRAERSAGRERDYEFTGFELLGVDQLPNLPEASRYNSQTHAP